MTTPFIPTIVGGLVGLPQMIAAFGGAPNALPKEQVLQNFGINIGAVVLFAYLFSQDKKAEALQLARLGREETLGAQYVSASPFSMERDFVGRWPPFRFEAKYDTLAMFRDVRQVELVGGKLLRLRDLRSFARVVIVAGSPKQVWPQQFPSSSPHNAT